MTTNAQAPVQNPARLLKPGGLVRKALACWQLYVLLAPTLAYFVIFNYVPMYGAVIAFKDFTPAQGIFYTHGFQPG